MVMSYSVCQTKAHFDIEFEAQRAAAIAEHEYGDEMMAYQCGRHWHITHVDPDKRRGAGHRFEKCEQCGELYKRFAKKGKTKKHVCLEVE